MRAAMESGRRGSNNASFHWMISGMLEQSEPITGAPHRIASKTGIPNPSCHDGKTKRAHRL
jgi:hypothetical protein